MTAQQLLVRELQQVLREGRVLDGAQHEYLHDATLQRGIIGSADAIAFPTSTAGVARLVEWCYRHDVPMVPRGGGTGFAGGAVPVEGGVVVALEGMHDVRSFEPWAWRLEADAGVTTARVRALARQSGLLFPPDPGAAEQSQIGGNIATNAGGPHAFKYGVTGSWVTGIEAVLPQGQVVTFGGRVRKDATTLNVPGLLTGSEGTLGIITAAWLRLIPAPEAVVLVLAAYEDVTSGCRAVQAVIENGLVPSALEYLDAGALAAVARTCPIELPPTAAFVIIAEADGTTDAATALARELSDVLADDAVVLEQISATEAASLWRWRDTVSHAVTTQRGGKLSEDVVVPVERLAEAIEGTLAIGERFDLSACSWGHAGDGNLHSSFLVAVDDEKERLRGESAVTEMAKLAVSLGGAISGEHGVGLLKREHLPLQVGTAEIDVLRSIKAALDPHGLMNPCKKLPSSQAREVVDRPTG
jgi:glycolate oxidase subunit GlcD